MKTFWVTSTCVLMLGAALGAQSTTDKPAPSLGELARELREKKNTSAPKAKRVYDNQNLPKDPNAAWRASAREASAEESADASAASAAAPGASAKKDDKKEGGGEDEKAWRDRFTKLRENLALETRRLDVLQRELNLAQIQNYSDPNQAMREQFQRTEITKRTTEIDTQKQAVETAKKAISDAEEQARQKGVPIGWTQP